MTGNSRRFTRSYPPGTVWFFVPACLLLIPFLNFARSNAYPLLSVEIALATGILLAVGITLGAIGQIHRIACALVVAATLTLLIDVQSRIFFDLSLHQYVWIPIALFFIMLLIPKRVESGFLVMAFTMLLVVVATPPRAAVTTIRSVTSNPDNGFSPSSDSYWIHIIIDEHIGVEAIPIEYDPDRMLARRIRNDYVADGFTIFGRAFTRFPQTHLSIPNILNFSEKHPVLLLAPGSEDFTVLESSYLDRLHDSGYRIHIYSSDYLQICEAARDSWPVDCYRYAGNGIWGLEGVSLPRVDKARVILRMYGRLSKIFSRTLEYLPFEIPTEIPRSVAPLVAPKAFAQFENDLLTSGSGSAWLVHVMLSHDPYALNEDCTVRALPWQGNGSSDEETNVWNTPEQRHLRYPLYLDQLACTHGRMQQFFETLKQAGIYHKAHIVVHGDHGSRLAAQNLRQLPSYDSRPRPDARNLIDYYGTLFAYKPAGATLGEYRRDMTSVATLLERASSGGLASHPLDELHPYVYLIEWDDFCTAAANNDPGCRLLSVPLPRFSAGRESEKVSLSDFGALTDPASHVRVK